MPLSAYALAALLATAILYLAVRQVGSAAPQSEPPPEWLPPDLAQRVAGVGGSIAYSDYMVCDSGAVCILDVRSGATRVLTVEHHVGEGYSWHPSGGLLAYGSLHDVYVLSLDSTVARLLSDDGQRKGWPSWDRSGSRIAVVLERPGGSVVAVYPTGPDGRASGPAKVIAAAEKGARSVSLSPDGHQVAFTRRGGIWACPVPDGPARALAQASSFGYSAPAWSPNGRRVAYIVRCGDGGRVWTVEADTGAASEVVPGRVFSSGADIGWSPDGSLLLCNDGILWVIDPTAGRVGALLAHPPEPLPRLGPMKYLAQWGGLGGTAAWGPPGA